MHELTHHLTLSLDLHLASACKLDSPILLPDDLCRVLKTSQR